MAEFAQGFVGALTDSINRQYQRNLEQSQADDAQQRAVFSHLVKSGDPELAALGLSGLVSPPKRNVFGKLKESPQYGQIQQIIGRLQSDATREESPERALVGAPPPMRQEAPSATFPQSNTSAPMPTGDPLSGMAGSAPAMSAKLPVEEADLAFERQLQAQGQPQAAGQVTGATAPMLGSAPPIPGAGPMAPPDDASPQELIQTLQPTPEGKVRLDSPAKVIAMLRLRALGGDPQGRALADLVMADQSAGAPWEQTIQKIQAAAENRADPMNAKAQQQGALAGLRAQNQMDLERLRQEGRTGVVEKQQAGAMERTKLQQAGAMDRAQLAAKVRWGIADAGLKYKQDSAGNKPLSGEAAKVYSIATTVLPEAERLKQVFATKGYRNALAGWMSGQDRELVKLVDNVADKVGRLRSGGAINHEEEKRFKGQIASMMDFVMGDEAAAVQAIDGIMTEARTVRDEIRMPSGGNVGTGGVTSPPQRKKTQGKSAADPLGIL